jgi:inhibitor of KinA
MIEPLGDSAVLLRVGDHIDDMVRRRVRAVCARLEAGLPSGTIEIVPAFTTVAVHYDPLRTSYADIAAALMALVTDVEEASLPPARTITIPVSYGGASGPDLEHVANHAGFSTDEVVRLHAGAEYVVHMIGFAPGFAYLGGLDARIACPRRESPRTHVPAGSVGIGGSQTGIYPIETPGGWQIIGRTDLKLFDPAREPAAVLQTGDRVRFIVSEP